MCGIVGIISPAPNNDAIDLVKQMNATQVHRGPDGQATWSSFDNCVHFGHTRLAIIDLSQAGVQPMVSVDGRFTVTFNGEIYNHQELRIECEKLGSRFSSSSDTEVIIECFRHFGNTAVKKFRGMWAFALYDRETNCVKLSRDPFGIKPLHIAWIDGSLVFSSEIKAIRALGGFNSPDEVTIELFESRGLIDVGSWTFFERILRFPAASIADLRLGSKLDYKVTKYWCPNEEVLSISPADAQEELRRLLLQSMTRHIRSDVPIAFCLSGGLDSSTLVCLAEKLLGSSGKVQSFTTSYPAMTAIDETKWAKMAIENTTVKGNWILPTPEEFGSDFDSVLLHHDEPISSVRVHAQKAIYRGISDEGIKVCIDGQGADELLGGYLMYFNCYLNECLNKRQIIPLASNLIGLLFRQPKVALGFLKERFLIKLRRKKSRGFSRNEDLSEKARKRFEEISVLTHSHGTRELLATQLSTTSIPGLLRNSDRSSMMYSVESRVPFLDVDVVDFLLSLPVSMKLKNGVTKHVLREAVAEVVPLTVIRRRDKLGFPAPEEAWLRSIKAPATAWQSREGFRKFIVSRWRKVVLDGA